jgi:glycosyltransferase involved in cell wall biosynthesis
MSTTEEILMSDVKAGARASRRKTVLSKTTIYILDLLPTVPYYTGHLCAALKDAPGIDLRLAATTYTHDRSFFERIGVRTCGGIVDIAGKVHLYRPICRVSKALEYLFNLVGLIIRFSLRRPAILHVQFLPLAEHRVPFELWFLGIVRKLGVKVVYTVHNVVPHNSAGDIKRFYLRVYRMMDIFICHDHVAKQELSDCFGIDAGNVFVIPHGVLFGEERTEVNNSFRDKLGIGSDDVVVLWQGIIGPYKGLPFLLSTWKEVRKRGVRGWLMIVGIGDGPLMNEIRQQVATLGLSDSVRLDFRFIPREELSELYEAADVVVFPYNKISTSGALMTAMRFGKAILASSLPGFKSVLEHERNAFLAPYGEIELWAEALIRLIEDRRLREELGVAVHQTQSEIPSWREIARHTVAVYERVMSNTSTSRYPSIVN